MDCLVSRQQFVSYWRRELGPGDQRELLTHLGGCSSCDNAFRLFAVTAPVLYSRFTESAKPLIARNRAPIVTTGGWWVWSQAWLALGLAAAFAAIATAYLSVPWHVTFEDAVAEEGGQPRVVAHLLYHPTENLFSPEVSKPVGQSRPARSTLSDGKRKHLDG
jgi:hypothetical protein